jgi:hypothetical protein
LASSGASGVDPAATSETLNAMTQALTCSSYFDLLTQYNINPPTFKGAEQTIQSCVDAAVKDAGSSGVISFATMRTFAGCEQSHNATPADQVNIFLSPDMKAAGYGETADMCTTTSNGYHGFGISVPNWTVVPVNTGCNPGMSQVMEDESHEMVELVSDPAGLGWVHESVPGRFITPELGANLEEQYNEGELADICSPVGLFPTPPTPFNDPALGLGPLSVAPYWSDQDDSCQPRHIADQTFATLTGSPVIRFTGSVHDLSVPVSIPAGMGNDALESLELLVVTGGDNLNSGSAANATAEVTGAQAIATDGINQGAEWGNNTEHAVLLQFPHGIEASQLTSIELSTNFGGGLSGDNWNVNGVIVKAALGPPPACPPTSATLVSDTSTTRLSDGSQGLIRMTGSTHALTLPMNAGPAIANLPVTDLQLTVGTGGDDLRGGSAPSDNANAVLSVGPNLSITFPNINQSANWQNWTTHTVDLDEENSLPAGTTAGDLTQFALTTSFGGGLSGDNWDVSSLTLTASLGCASASPPPTPPAPQTVQLLNVTGTTKLPDGSTGLARLTGDVHDFPESIPAVPAGEAADVVVGLQMTITTGGDDLRGGSDGGDNATVTVGGVGTFPDVNQRQDWGNNSAHTFMLTPIPPSVPLGNLTSADISTMFGGGINGDNWDIAGVQLQATVIPAG